MRISQQQFIAMPHLVQRLQQLGAEIRRNSFRFIGSSLLLRDTQLVGATEDGLPNCGGYIPVCL